MRDWDTMGTIKGVAMVAWFIFSCVVVTLILLAAQWHSRPRAYRLRDWPLALLRSIAHPEFACADCIGMIPHGCWCAYHNASSPGMPPTRRQRLALFILAHLED